MALIFRGFKESILRLLPLFLLIYICISEFHTQFYYWEIFSFNLQFIIIYYWILRDPDILGYGFVFAMWVLIIIGGGIMVVLLGPFSIQQYGDFHWIVESGIKVTIALILVVIWILILSKLKNWIFKKELNS